MKQKAPVPSVQAWWNWSVMVARSGPWRTQIRRPISLVRSMGLSVRQAAAALSQAQSMAGRDFSGSVQHGKPPLPVLMSARRSGWR